MATTTRTPPFSEAMKECIENCQKCQAECLETATHTCLETGGKHLEPEHVRLMLSCAEVCGTCAKLMLTRSTFEEALCAVCADICEACARSCEQIGGMDRCAELCRRCATTCRSMAGLGGGKGKEKGREAPTRSHA